jgi:predicted nucleic acid-binding protein
MYLLDTNIVSESRKLGTSRIDPVAASWLDRIDAAQTFLSAMTIFELGRGVQQMEHRDPTQGQMLRRWLNDQVMPTYEARILPLSATVAHICAGLHIPNPRSERDAWIAATALDASLTLATRNLADFTRMGVKLVNPFEREAVS